MKNIIIILFAMFSFGIFTGNSVAKDKTIVLRAGSAWPQSSPCSGNGPGTQVSAAE